MLNFAKATMSRKPGLNGDHIIKIPEAMVLLGGIGEFEGVF